MWRWGIGTDVGMVALCFPTDDWSPPQSGSVPSPPTTPNPQADSSTVNLTPVGSADGATPATITAVRDDSSGVGLTIASVQSAANADTDGGTDQGESSHAEMFIDSTGNVGLGVADPTDRLSVSGNIRATGEITVRAFFFVCNSAPTAAGDVPRATCDAGVVSSWPLRLFVASPLYPGTRVHGTSMERDC